LQAGNRLDIASQFDSGWITRASEFRFARYLQHDWKDDRWPRNSVLP
jgi:hypothetical protein